MNSRGGIHPSAGKEFIAFVNRINKKLVDDSVPRNTEKSTKYAETIRALELRNCREGCKINKPLFGFLVFRKITHKAKSL